jgi:hypothetical protein
MGRHQNEVYLHAVVGDGSCISGLEVGDAVDPRGRRHGLLFIIEIQKTDFICPEPLNCDDGSEDSSSLKVIPYIDTESSIRPCILKITFLRMESLIPAFLSMLIRNTYSPLISISFSSALSTTINHHLHLMSLPGSANTPSPCTGDHFSECFIQSDSPPASRSGSTILLYPVSAATCIGVLQIHIHALFC